MVSMGIPHKDIIEFEFAIGLGAKDDGERADGFVGKGPN